MNTPFFSKVLIANRGEVALRIVRALHDLGIASVAVYADDDAASPHVGAATQAVALGATGPAAYLDGAPRPGAGVGLGGADRPGSRGRRRGVWGWSRRVAGRAAGVLVRSSGMCFFATVQAWESPRGAGLGWVKTGVKRLPCKRG